MRCSFLLLLISLSLNADYVRWFSSYEKAHKEALLRDKVLMVLLLQTRDNKLLKDIFMEQSYIKTLKKDFVSVLVIKDQKNSYPIELLYTVQYPAIFFLDENELMICDILSGIITEKTFQKYLNKCK